jgi:hypothetical protein
MKTKQNKLSLIIAIYFVISICFCYITNVYSPFWVRKNQVRDFILKELVIVPFPTIFIIPTLNTKNIRTCYRLASDTVIHSSCDKKNYFIFDYEVYLNLRKLSFALTPLQWFLESNIQKEDPLKSALVTWSKYQNGDDVLNKIPPSIVDDTMKRKLRISRYMIYSIFSYYCSDRAGEELELIINVDLINTEKNKIYKAVIRETHKCD